MKKTILLASAILFSLAAHGAKVTYSPSGQLTFIESTDWGEISMTFSKCMANKLYTFSSIKLNDKEVNSTAFSDNIGPFLVNGFWMGGNHDYNGTPTAKTMNVNVKVDDVELKKGRVANGSVATIEVENELYYIDGVKFANETVTYVVSGNSIEVYADHAYTHPTPMVVSRYYGMQSTFGGETELLLPGSGVPTWRTLTVSNTGNEVNVLKSEAPLFCTYIEHSPLGYQASYMVPENLGDRQWVVNDNDIVFTGNNWGKSYHKLIGDKTVQDGMSSSWHGIYSWFDAPIVDNCRDNDADHTFAYGAYIDGVPVVMTLDADGTLSHQTAGLSDIVSDSAEPFARVEQGRIVISPATPGARCYDISGNLVHRGAGSFDCAPGVYIVNDLQGHSLKLIIK